VRDQRCRVCVHPSQIRRFGHPTQSRTAESRFIGDKEPQRLLRRNPPYDRDRRHEALDALAVPFKGAPEGVIYVRILNAVGHSRVSGARDTSG
jgi:hypothetical protein